MSDDSIPTWARCGDGEEAAAEINAAIAEHEKAHERLIERALMCMWLRSPGLIPHLEAIGAIRQHLAILKLIKARSEELQTRVKG